MYACMCRCICVSVCVRVFMCVCRCMYDCVRVCVRMTSQETEPNKVQDALCTICCHTRVGAPSAVCTATVFCAAIGC